MKRTLITVGLLALLALVPAGLVAQAPAPPGPPIGSTPNYPVPAPPPPTGPGPNYPAPAPPTDTPTPVPTPTNTPTRTPTPRPSPTPTPTASPTPAQTLSPEKPVVTVKVGGTIRLEWGETLLVVVYEVWAWDGSWTHLGTTQDSHYVHMDFVPGREYQYTVRAVTESGQASAWSDYVSATAPTSAAPTLIIRAISGGPVEISWTPVSDAARYLLWVHDAESGWQQVASDLTTSPYVDTERTIGVTYHYTIAAVDADGNQGPWSKQEWVRPYDANQDVRNRPLGDRFGIEIGKQIRVGGVIVAAEVGVPDGAVERTREIISAILADRPDLLAAMEDYHAVVLIRPQMRGGAASHSRNVDENLFVITAVVPLPVNDPVCRVVIHEFAHLIHFTLYELTPGHEFDQRLQALYRSTMDAGLWSGLYGSTSHKEYWAEAVTFWLQDEVPAPHYSTLEEYDPRAVALIEETLGDAEVPWYCTR